MTRKKGKQHVFKMYGAKTQKLTHQNAISKIAGIDLKKRCKDQNDQMLSKEKKPNEKLLTQCNQFYVEG